MDTKSQSGFNLSTPVRYLKGVGPARAAIFSRLGVETVEDLLEYFPRDWVFAPKPTKINRIKPGDNVTVTGLLESTDFRRFARPPVFQAVISDDSGVCRIIWFHGRFLQKKLKVGSLITASGKSSLYKHQLQLTNPIFAVVDQNNQNPDEYFSGGVYPASSGLSSRQIKRIIRPVLDKAAGLVNEFYTDGFRRNARLIARKDAVRWIHLPLDKEKLTAAKRRMKYDELFLMQLGLALKRYRVKHFSRAARITWNEKVDKRIRKRFPFLLTEDQNTVIEEIRTDMAEPVPMNRLLQGDVGSGKTVVALYAALLAVANKQQTAIMAPTEILASQHFISIERYLKNSDVKRVCITGGLKGQKRKQILKQLEDGKIDIVVGTVALLQKDIEFKSLGLVVIDEQHKFGVEQRERLRKKTTPHCLIMTATPIPRTLAMTAFGDLDVSIIKHCPCGRGNVITRWVQPNNRPKAYDFIKQQLKTKKQAYFVCPRITGIEENGDVKAAIDQHKKLSQNIFLEYTVGLLHGRMSPAEKQKIMDSFRKGKINVLVSTIVIEVGIDVPSATVMVIEGADRFGLAQLHQLRGRIGRGRNNSYCLLFAETENEIARERLKLMARSNDGFEIAEYDLRLRGPGEMLSTRQHGLPDLKIANIIDDFELLVMARKNAFKLTEQDPMLKEAGHKNIRKALLARFKDSLRLVDIA